MKERKGKIVRYHFCKKGKEIRMRTHIYKYLQKEHKIVTTETREISWLLGMGGNKMEAIINDTFQNLPFNLVLTVKPH